MAQFEAMWLEIACLKRERDEQRGEIERLRAERLEPTLYQQRLQEQLDSCRRLLRKALKSRAVRDICGTTWSEAAKQAAGGGE